MMTATLRPPTLSFVRDRILLSALISLMGVMSFGCASVGNPDPLSSINRPVFEFNDAIDRNLLKPTAQGYRDITPSGLRRSVNNFFNNLDAPYSAANSLLQGEWSNAGKEVGRFLINSTLGILGLFDVAGDDMGITANREDFGQTLGAWGIGRGAYIVLPFFGPTNFRDGLSRFVVDNRFNTLPKEFRGKGERAELAWTLFNVVRIREQFLDAEARAGATSLDRYSFIRSISEQSRQVQVYNGMVPKATTEDESWLDEN